MAKVPAGAAKVVGELILGIARFATHCIFPSLLFWMAHVFACQKSPLLSANMIYIYIYTDRISVLYIKL